MFMVSGFCLPICLRLWPDPTHATYSPELCTHFGRNGKRPQSQKSIFPQSHQYWRAFKLTWNKIAETQHPGPTKKKNSSCANGLTIYSATDVWIVIGVISRCNGCWCYLEHDFRIKKTDEKLRHILLIVQELGPTLDAAEIAWRAAYHRVQMTTYLSIGSV